jgi:hypothetical protein
MAWMDVDPTHEDVFDRWYNEEHIGRLLEDHNVLRSSAFLDAVRYQPSPGRPAHMSPATICSGCICARRYLAIAWP